MNRNIDNPHNHLDLQFEILEKNDGITGQIIYEGDPMSIVNYTWRNRRKLNQITHVGRDTYIQKYIILITFPLCTFLLAMILNKFLKPINDKVFNKMVSFFENRLFNIPIRIFADIIPIPLLIAMAIGAGTLFYLVKSGVIMGNLDIQIPNTVRP